jgi:proteasome lid subunit RPN8/RPN11
LFYFVLQTNNVPFSVMGLMLGRPDPHKPTNLIVTDAFPLPIEGFETRVVADDQSVVNHMISLGERLEKTRKEKFMGWYHSHPFDLVLGEESRSHCFLSQTDLSTQLQWQRAEDPHGNPFAAIVVDPLLSMHTGTPQLKAFRAYPPEYQSAIPNECPDGSIVASEKLRLEKWGSCWNRYYELKVEYYMSEASRSVLGDLTQNYLWMKSFQRDSNESGVKGVSASEAIKVTTLREIATDVRSEVGSSRSEGRTPLAHPTSRASAIEPLVRKLRETATLAITQQTARCVHTNIFKAPNAAGKDETKKGESEAIATTVTH